MNPDDPAVAEVIADWKHTPGTVGIRIMMTREAGRPPTQASTASCAPPCGTTCRSACCAGATWTRAGRCSTVTRHARFILDHLALVQPRTPPAPPQPWADLPKVLDLATRPNAVIKVSGACTLSQQPYPFPDIWDPLARVLDAWGFDRCLWGTDWTPRLRGRQLRTGRRTLPPDRPPERQ